MIGIHDRVIYLFTFVNVVVKKKIQAKGLNVPASREIKCSKELSYAIYLE